VNFGQINACGGVLKDRWFYRHQLLNQGFWPPEAKVGSGFRQRCWVEKKARKSKGKGSVLKRRHDKSLKYGI